jgi:hypothetical protein
MYSGFWKINPFATNGGNLFQVAEGLNLTSIYLLLDESLYLISLNVRNKNVCVYMSYK